VTLFRAPTHTRLDSISDLNRRQYFYLFSAALAVFVGDATRIAGLGPFLVSAVLCLASGAALFSLATTPWQLFAVPDGVWLGGPHHGGNLDRHWTMVQRTSPSRRQSRSTVPTWGGVTGCSNARGLKRYRRIPADDMVSSCHEH
jgi:hypothetical protein